MDIRQLKYFVAIAEEGKITAAARRLHMAQPPLSKQLKGMEDELGVLLVERHKRKVSLTPEGEVFYKNAKQLLASFSELVTEMQEMSKEAHGFISVGSSLYCASLMLSKMRRMRAKYPDMQYKVWEGDAVRLGELIENREIEIAISSSPVPVKGLSSFRLPPDPIVLVIPKHWSLADREREAAGFQRIADLPLIVLRSASSDGMYGRIMKCFADLGEVPRILCECHDSAMLLSMVTGGFGAALLPKSVLDLSPPGNYKVLQITDSPLCSEPFVFYRSSGYLSKAAKEYLELFK